MATVNIFPAPGYILLEPQKKETTTASGIVLPENQQEKTQSGKVISVGDTYQTDSGFKKESPCKVGNVVVFKEWGGTEYKSADKIYLLVKFDDILAIIK